MVLDIQGRCEQIGDIQKKSNKNYQSWKTWATK